MQVAKEGFEDKPRLEDGDKVVLKAAKLGLYCAVAFDSSVICIEAASSAASHNVFTLRLSPPPSSSDGLIL